MRRACYLIVSLALLGQLTDAAIWRDDEAIIVDDTPAKDATSPPAPNRCVTSDGAVGSCIPAKECYPHVFPNTDQGKFFGDSYSFRDSYANFSEPCEVDGETTLSSDGSESRPPNPGDERICCATLSRAIADNVAFPSYTVPEAVEAEVDPTDPATAPTCSYFNYTHNPIVTEKLLIVGGQPVSITRYPFMVSIFRLNQRSGQWNPHCGGSLIGPNVVLTAAHCVDTLRTPESLQLLKIYLGAQNHNAPQETGRVVRGVSTLAMHSKFNMKDFRDDIAILKLTAPVQYSDRIRAICCTSCSETGNTEVAGWGKTVDKGPGSPTLRAVEIPIWDNAQCRQKYQQFGSLTPQISPGMLCAGSQDGRKDSCQGDSGGPLFKTGGCQVGIVSWGIGCGQYPGVYTRVSKYQAWIEKYQKKFSQ